MKTVCRWFRCSRLKIEGDRYCRDHRERFDRPPIPLIIEPLDRSQKIRRTIGGPLRGCIEQYKKANR